MKYLSPSVLSVPALSLLSPSLFYLKKNFYEKLSLQRQSQSNLPDKMWEGDQKQSWDSAEFEEILLEHLKSEMLML